MNVDREIPKPSLGEPRNEELEFILREYRRNVDVMVNNYNQISPEKKQEMEDQINMFLRESMNRKLWAIFNGITEKPALASIIIIIIILIIG